MGDKKQTDKATNRQEQPADKRDDRLRKTDYSESIKTDIVDSDKPPPKPKDD